MRNLCYSQHSVFAVRPGTLAVTADADVAPSSAGAGAECCRPSRPLLQIRIRAGEDLDQARFGLRILFQAVADGLA